MPTIFGLPDPEDTDLLTRARDAWHPDLRVNGVRVQMIFAETEDGSPAVKHHGYPALATVRVVPLKDRITKGYDAEMLVDRAFWNLAGERGRLALIDHELSHIEVKKREEKPPKGTRRKPGEPVPLVVCLDDLGRPKLKLKKGDWNPGDGFGDVVARHGDAASEFEDLRRAFLFAQKAKDKGEEERARRGLTRCPECGVDRPEGETVCPACRAGAAA